MNELDTTKELNYSDLTNKQLEFCVALYTLGSLEEVSKKMGMHKNTVFAWQKKLKPYIEQFQVNIPGVAREIVKNNSINAANKLVEIMNDKKQPRSQVQAASEILDRAGLTKGVPTAQVNNLQQNNVTYQIVFTDDPNEDNN